MTEYDFFYDESEHSRKINYTTVNSDNFYQNFTTSIVGWKTSNKKEIQTRWNNFDEKWSNRKKQVNNHFEDLKQQNKSEFKSSTISNKTLKKGFASLKNDSLKFIEDFLNLFADDTYVYYSVTSKIQYICQQLLNALLDPQICNVKSFTYSLTKAISQYEPLEVEKILLSEDLNVSKFIETVCDFLQEKIDEDKQNVELKHSEIINYTIMYKCFSLLTDEEKKKANNVINENWKYDNAFQGFEKYLEEQKINDYLLIIDRENNTLNTARRYLGKYKCIEMNSEDNFGIQMADLFVGLITKLMRAMRKELAYNSKYDAIKKHLLSSEWFELNDTQLEMYHKLYVILTKYNDSFYKTYVSIYSDDFVYLISLLEELYTFNSAKEMYTSRKNISERINDNAAIRLRAMFNEF